LTELGYHVTYHMAAGFVGELDPFEIAGRASEVKKRDNEAEEIEGQEGDKHHCLLHVKLDKSDPDTYYVDVGYGDPIPKVLLIEYNVNYTIEDGRTFRFRKSKDVATVLEYSPNFSSGDPTLPQAWIKRLKWFWIPRKFEDYYEGLEYVCNNPKSMAVQKTLVSKLTRDHRRISLAGSKMVITTLPNKAREVIKVQEGEYRQVLKQYFGIDKLGDDEDKYDLVVVSQKSNL